LGSIEFITDTAFHNTNASSRPEEVERYSIRDIDVPIYIRLINFINFDGPAQALAERFSALSGYPVVPSDGFHPTPGSLGSWVGIGMQQPILTLEHERGQPPERCWAQTQAAILAVIEG